MPACPHCATDLAPDATLCTTCGIVLTIERGQDSDHPVRVYPPEETRTVYALPLAVFGFAICLTSVFLEISPFVIGVGFLGFMMFVIGGLTHLMKRVQS